MLTWSDRARYPFSNPKIQISNGLRFLAQLHDLAAHARECFVERLSS